MVKLKLSLKESEERRVGAFQQEATAGSKGPEGLGVPLGVCAEEEWVERRILGRQEVAEQAQPSRP